MSHERCLLKVKSHELDGLQYFLLSNHFQAVGVNGTLTQPQAATDGVVQGSVLGNSILLPFLTVLFLGALFLFARDN